MVKLQLRTKEKECICCSSGKACSRYVEKEAEDGVECSVRVRKKYHGYGCGSGSEREGGRASGCSM